MVTTLTLQWTELGQTKIQIIHDQHNNTKHPGTFRIGRDPSQCDLILSDERISRLHIEIFFRSDWQRFYLRNLKPHNPLEIDGGKLIEGEVALSKDSLINLGKTKLKVTDITINGGELAASLPTTIVIVNPESEEEESSPQYEVNFLQCSNCEAIWSQDMRESACPRCGHFLVDARSIVVSEENLKGRV